MGRCSTTPTETSRSFIGNSGKIQSMKWDGEKKKQFREALQKVDRDPVNLEIRAIARGRSLKIQTDKDGYSQIVDAVNAAIHLHRLLMVTGVPGTGKTSLAYAIAYELQLGPVLVWPITATMRSPVCRMPNLTKCDPPPTEQGRPGKSASCPRSRLGKRKFRALESGINRHRPQVTAGFLLPQGGGSVPKPQSVEDTASERLRRRQHESLRNSLMTGDFLPTSPVPSKNNPHYTGVSAVERLQIFSMLYLTE